MVLYNKPVPLRSPTITPEQVKQETSQNLPSGISLHIPQKSAMGPQTPGQPIPMVQPKPEIPVVSQPQQPKKIDGRTYQVMMTDAENRGLDPKEVTTALLKKGVQIEKRENPFTRITRQIFEPSQQYQGPGGQLVRGFGKVGMGLGMGLEGTVKGAGALIEKAGRDLPSMIAGALIDQETQNALEVKETMDKTFNTKPSQDVLALIDGFTTTAAYGLAPLGMAALGVGSEIPVTQPVVNTLMDATMRIGGQISSLPGFREFKDMLPTQEEKDQADMLRGSSLVGMLLGTKNKRNIVKNPRKFVAENLSPRALEKNFYENVVNIPLKVTGKRVYAPKDVQTHITKGLRPSKKSVEMAGDIAAYTDKAFEGAKSIAKRKNLIELTDSTGERVKGELPKTISQFDEAIPQAKRKIYQDYASEAKKAGEVAKVETTPVLQELINLRGELEDMIGTKGTVKYLDEMIKEIQSKPEMDVLKALDNTQQFNSKLQAFFRNPDPNNAGNVIVDNLVNNILKEEINKTIESSLSEKSQYKKLKKEYANLKAIEKDVKGRAVVDARQNVKGFFDMSEIFTAGEAVRALVTMQPAGLAASATMTAMTKFFKYLNDPNRHVRKIFEKVGKTVETLGETAPIPAQTPRMKGIPYKEGGMRFESEKAQIGDARARSAEIRETGQENITQPTAGEASPPVVAREPEPTQIKEPTPTEPAPVEKQPTGNEKFYNELETKPITDVSKFKKGMQTPDGEIIQVGFNGPRAFFRVKGDKPYTYRYSGEAKALPKPKVDEKANLKTMVEQGQRRSLYTKQALDDLGVNSLEDLDAPQIQELAQLIRARNFDDKWYARWEKLKADVTKEIKSPKKKEISGTEPVQLNKVSSVTQNKQEGLFADVEKPKTKPLPKPKQEKVQLEERKPVEKETKGLEEKVEDPKAGMLTADGYSGVKEKVIDGIKVTSKKDSGEYASITFEYKGKEYSELVSRRIKEDFDTSDRFYTNYNVIDDRTIKSIIETTKRIEDGREQVIRDYPSLKDAKGTMLKFHFEDYMGKYGTKPLTPEIAFKNAILEIGPDAKSWLVKRGNYTEKDVITDVVKESIKTGKITKEQAFADAKRIKQQKQIIADLYDRYSKEPTKKEVKVGLGNRRDVYEKEGGQQNGMRGADILRAIADDSKSSKELSDVLDRVKEYPEGKNITRAVSKNPNASKEVKARAMKMYDSYGKPTKGLTKTKSEGLFTKEDVKNEKLELKPKESNGGINVRSEKDFITPTSNGKYNAKYVPIVTKGMSIEQAKRQIEYLENNYKGRFGEKGDFGISIMEERDILRDFVTRKNIYNNLGDEKVRFILDSYGDTPRYSGKIKGDRILNIENPSEKSYYEGLDYRDGEIKVSVAYIFKDGNKLRQDTMTIDIDNFLKKYTPVKNKTTAEKIALNIKKTEQSDSRLMKEYTKEDYIGLAKDIDPNIGKYIAQTQGLTTLKQPTKAVGLFETKETPKKEAGLDFGGKELTLKEPVKKSRFAEGYTKEKISEYVDEYVEGKPPLQKANIRKNMEGLSLKLMYLADFSDITKIYKDPIDPRYVVKYIHSNKDAKHLSKEIFIHTNKTTADFLTYMKDKGGKGPAKFYEEFNLKMKDDLAPGEVRDPKTGMRMLKEEKEFFDEIDEQRAIKERYAKPKEYKGYTIQRHQEGRMGNKTETYAIRKGQKLIKTIPVDQGKDIKPFIDGLVEKESKKVGLADLKVQKYETSMKVDTPDEALLQEARKYKTADEFLEQFEYHGGPEEIKGGKLERLMADGGDMGGVFTTKDKDYANIYANNYLGKGKLHRVYVGDKKIIDLTSKEGIQKMKDFIGKKYKNNDGELVKFTQQDFDFLFPTKDGADRGAYDYHGVVEEMGFDGARILERADYKGRKVTSTVFNEGGLKVYDEEQLRKIREEANKKKIGLSNK